MARHSERLERHGWSYLYKKDGKKRFDWNNTNSGKFVIYETKNEANIFAAEARKMGGEVEVVKVVETYQMRVVDEVQRVGVSSKRRCRS